MTESTTVGAVDRLRFHGWIPPRIVEDDVTCGRKVQAGSRSAQTQQKERTFRVILKRVHHSLTFLGFARQNVYHLAGFVACRGKQSFAAGNGRAAANYKPRMGGMRRQ